MKKTLIILTVLSLLMMGCTKETEKVTNPSPDQINYSRLAVTAISKLTGEKLGDFYQMFDEQMQKELPEAELKQIWNDVLQQMGAFQYYSSDFTLTPQNNGTVADVPCVFKNGQLIIRLTFNSSGKISGLFLLDSSNTTKVSPRLTIDQDITIGKEPWVLSGSLTLPEGEGPFPLVILVHGSGPSDRNEQIGPNLPFLDIAHALSQQGIATLRYDKRTYTYPKEMASLEDLTVYEEVIDDVASAFKFAQTLDKIDHKNIYIAGHSFGGSLIPRIAEETPKAAGYMIMAGAARPLEDLLLEQTQYTLSLDTNTDQETKDTVLSQTQTMVGNIKSLTKKSSFTAKELLGVPASYWLDLQGYEPAVEAQKIDQPLLIVQGGRDYQVTKTDFDIWQTQLANNRHVTFKYYDNLNHLFMAGTGKSNPNEYQVKGSVSESITNDLAEFIHNNQ